MSTECIRIVEIERINKSGNFLIYDKNADRNIVIISSCRLSSFAYYFNCLEGFNYNIYMIYIVPYMQNSTFPDIEKLNKIFEKTDMIICENIKNFPGFNTSEECKHNSIFDTFNINKETRIFRIPPLELRCFAYSNFHLFKCDIHSFKSFGDSSKEFLENRLSRDSYHKTKKFIQTYFQTIQLFHTHNHPSNILMLVLFIEFISNSIGLRITKDFVNKCYNKKFLDGNEVPIFNIDIINNDFKFIKKVEHDNIFLTPGFLWFDASNNISKNVNNLELNNVLIDFFELKQ